MKNLIKIFSLVSIFGMGLPSYADQTEHDEVIEESLSLPFSVKYALKQLCLVLKNDNAEDLIPHAIALVNQKKVDNELVEQGLQEAMSCADEILSRENITKSHKAILAYIKKTIEDYHNFLMKEASDQDEAEYRSRPYHTPAIFNGPVFIADINDPQGYAALTVNGLANFTDVNIETVTIDTLDVANLTVSNSLVLSYLANNAGKFLYLSDNAGTVQATGTSGIGVQQINAGNNISVDISSGVHSPTINVADTTTNAVQIGSPNGALHSLSFGTSGYVLTSQGTGNSPQWEPLSSAGAVTSVQPGNNIAITGTATSPVVNVADTTTNAVQIGSPNGALHSLAVGTNGQVLLGATGAAPAFAALASTAATLTYTPGANSLNIDITAPVAITYGGTNATSFSSPDGVIYYDGTRLVTTNAGIAGTVLSSNGAGSSPTFKSLSSVGAITTINGDNGFVMPTNGAVTFNANSNAGGTVKFSGSGSTMDLLVTSPTTSSTAIGQAATAAGNNATSFGYNATAPSQYCTALGYSASTGLTRSTAMGALATADGQTSTAIGYNAAAPGTSSTAIGSGSQATGGSSSALGLDAVASGNNSLALGYNAGSSNASSSSGNNIYIANNGVAPESNVIRVGTEGTQAACYIAGINGITLPSGVPVYISPSTGQLGILSSSRRYKDNIVSVTNQDKLMELEPVQFTYKSDGSQRIQYGLIAEDVYEVYPELVVHNAQGDIETVRYDQLHALLLKGLQEQHDKIANQQNELDECKQLISEQKQNIDELYGRIVALEPAAI